MSKLNYSSPSKALFFFFQRPGSIDAMKASKHVLSVLYVY